MALGLARVEGLSMIPYLAPGDIVLMRYAATFALNDVVLVQHSQRVDIKRVTGITGTQIFVEGDNSAVSQDSRQYGEVHSEHVIARVLVRLPRWLARLAPKG